MKMGFTYSGRLAGRNEEIAANRSHWAAGAMVKKEAETALMWAIKAAQMQGRISPVETPVEICITWNEAPRRRDVDNIQSSAKYILDALQKSGIIPNDSQKWVKQVYQRVVQSEVNCVAVEISDTGWTIKEKEDGC